MARRLLVRLPLLMALTALSVSVTGERPALPTGAQVTDTLRTHWGSVGGLEYAVVEPAELAPDAELPMLVYLHGRGDRPRIPHRAIYGLRTAVRLIMPCGPEYRGDGYAWMPVSAHDGESKPFLHALDAGTRSLSDALRAWQERYPTRGRPIVAGFSQGAILAMSLAVSQPGSIARAIAMAGWLPPSRMPDADRYGPTTAIVALHGDNDPVLPAERTRTTIEELARRGYPARYEAFPRLGHATSPAVETRVRALIEETIRELPEAHNGRS